MKLWRSERDSGMPFGLRAPIRRMRRRPLAWLAAFWAIGAAAGYTAAPCLAFVLPALGFLLAAILSRRLSALCAAFAFIAAAVTGALSVLPEEMPRQKYDIAGVVCAEPRPNKEYLLLTLDDVTLNGEPYAHRVRLYLFDHSVKDLSVRYGDGVSAVASLSSPRGATGEGDHDSAAYYWRSGVALSGSAGAESFAITPGKPSLMRSVMFMREQLGARLDALYPQNSALARALVLGDKSMLTDEEFSAFTDAGIMHLLAVSGLHVSILAEALRLLLRHGLRLSRKASYWTVLPVLALYAAVTGFPASIKRAIICFALIDAAPILGRPADKLTGLSAAFLILCFFRPLSLFDAGFQLSFGAMLGICLISPVLASALTPAFMLRTALRKALWTPVMLIVSSIGATIGTLPAAAGLFGTLTLWSLLANIFAIPLTSLLMPVLLLSLLWDGAAWAGGLGLIGLDRLAQWFGDLPDALRVPVANMPWGFMAVYALIVLLCSAQTPLDKYRRRVALRLKAVGVCALAGVTALSSAWVIAPVRSEQGLQITFIDVDQGDSTLINAQGVCYMIDTGKNSSAADRLSSKAIPLAGLFLTHPDDDHAGRIADVLEAGRAKTVYLPECWPRLEIPEEAERALEGVSVRYLSAGDTLRLSEGVTATVLHPPKGYTPGESNAASLVLLIEYGKGSALMMGDIADEDIGFPVPDCDVLKLSHHGSASASGEYLLRAASPCAAIISAGANNGYGHPAPEVLDRLRRIGIPAYSTAQRGDISAKILPQGGASIESYLSTENGG